MDYMPNTMVSNHFLRKGCRTVVSPNERSILQRLWRKPGVARSSLNNFLDLSQQSIYRIVDTLVDRGIVTLGEPIPGQGRGQPSPSLRLNGHFAYSCGISINADAIHIYIMDLAGRLVGNDSVALTGQPMSEAIHEIRATIEKLRTCHALTEEANLAIGVGMTGYRVGGTRYNGPEPLREWSLIELGPLLSTELGKPVWIYNTSQMAAVAEAMFGVGCNIKNFAYLFISYGFGGGLISNGELLPGGTGNAGEFACLLDPTQIDKRPALVFLMNALEANGVEVPTVEYLQHNFRADWPGVSEWLDETIPAYNRIVNSISAVFAPEAIVLGGHVPPALANMLIKRTESFELARYGVPHPPVKYIVTELDGDAGAIGAAAVPFKQLMF